MPLLHEIIVYQVEVIGLGQMGWSIDNAPQRKGIGYESLLEVEASPSTENERMVDAVADIVDCIVSNK